MARSAASLVRQAARLIVEEALEAEAEMRWAAATTSMGRSDAATAMAIGRHR